MRLIVAIATGLFAIVASPAAAAPPRPAVEHLGRPNLNGQALPFSDAVRVGDTLYLSGQLGIGPDGKLPDGIAAQTRQALDNVGAILKRAGLTHADVFHCTAMLRDMADWPAMNAVYVTYFPEGKRPARSAFGASGLALGALIELECQAYAGKK
ncbi:MAG TPA: RidA family protein [Sphingomicrobium sp.]